MGYGSEVILMFKQIIREIRKFGYIPVVHLTIHGQVSGSLNVISKKNLYKTIYYEAYASACVIELEYAFDNIGSINIKQKMPEQLLQDLKAFANKVEAMGDKSQKDLKQLIKNYNPIHLGSDTYYICDHISHMPQKDIKHQLNLYKEITTSRKHQNIHNLYKLNESVKTNLLLMNHRKQAKGLPSFFNQKATISLLKFNIKDALSHNDFGSIINHTRTILRILDLPDREHFLIYNDYLSNIDAGSVTHLKHQLRKIIKSHYYQR